MSPRRTSSSVARSVQAAALLTAAAGLLTQFFAGVPGFPPVPPGPILLTAASLFVSLVPWRWAPVAGLAVSLVVMVAATVADVGTQFADATPVAPFVGSWLQALGLFGAVVAGLTALATSSPVSVQ